MSSSSFPLPTNGSSAVSALSVVEFFSSCNFASRALLYASSSASSSFWSGTTFGCFVLPRAKISIIYSVLRFSSNFVNFKSPLEHHFTESPLLRLPFSSLSFPFSLDFCSFLAFFLFRPLLPFSLPPPPPPFLC